MVTYIRANSNVFGMVKRIEIGQSAAKILSLYRIKFNDHRKQSEMINVTNL
nr:MAG TPA: hypothetical protein [Caudoviricetes sp.]